MKILFLKPPDRFLEDEFVYQQLGPHYLQSFLNTENIDSDLAILFEKNRLNKDKTINVGQETLSDLSILLTKSDGNSYEKDFTIEMLSDYDVIAMSVMTPQAPDAYRLSLEINKKYPHITTVIGGSHARYYMKSVCSLTNNIAFDFIIPHDGWKPMLDIATKKVVKGFGKSNILSHEYKRVNDLPAPTRPIELMKKYQFEIAGVKSFHTITALGCPFSCNFCESGKEKLRKFSYEMINDDLKTMSLVHDEIGNIKKGVMIFDDVGLMNPNQVKTLSRIINDNGFDTWRAFSHAFLVDRYKDKMLKPFYETGGRRIGLGLETGSQKTLDLLNKRNGQKQNVAVHYNAVKIANEMGIAIDAFTMIYPWESEYDLSETTRLIEFIANNPVKGVDELGRPLLNNVDSTIMTPYQGTAFNDMLVLGELPGVKMKKNLDPGLLFYKGTGGESGWPYVQTVLGRERYEEEQRKRIKLRPKYR